MSRMFLAARSFHSRRAGLALLVDAGADDTGPELAGEPEERVEPGAGLVALLEVDRIEDGPAADPLQGGARRRGPRWSRP